jgi:hypothetical protein
MDASFVANSVRGAIKQGGHAGKRVWHFRPPAGAAPRKFPGNSIEAEQDIQLSELWGINYANISTTKKTLQSRSNLTGKYLRNFSPLCSPAAVRLLLIRDT